MATLPAVIGYATDIQIAAQPTKTWIIDKSVNQVSYVDDGIEAVRQAVEIALSVQRFRWQIYDSNFGSELESLIGEDMALISAEFPRFVEDALSVDDRVISVDGYAYEQNGKNLTARCTVHSVYGEFIEEVTI